MPPPYSRIASVYDCTVGFPFFLRVRDAFERLVRRYGIRFGSAADIGGGTGLFVCYLNRFWGVPVFAVDRSGDMLRLARRNCHSESICLLQQDIRCLRLPSRVDLITGKRRASRSGAWLIGAIAARRDICSANKYAGNHVAGSFI